MNKISIIVPVHNEEECVEQFVTTVTPIVTALGEHEFVFIDDGSTDATYAKLMALHEQDPHIKVLSFSTNFGKEIALNAGLEHCTGDCAIPMDVDLQDPPELIEDLAAKWKEGHLMVNAQRTDRSEDSFLKASTASQFYRVFNKLSDTQIPPNVGDFRLIDRQVIDTLKQQFPERNRFLKGLLTLIAPDAPCIPYKRPSRTAGKTSFHPLKLLRTAFDGICAFSTAPIFMITMTGFVISFLALVYVLFIVASTFINGIHVPGYASITAIILFLGGFQIAAIGIIGTYIGKIYIEVKNRPMYILKSKAGFEG